MGLIEWDILDGGHHIAVDSKTGERLPYEVRSVPTLSGRGKPNYLALTRTDGKVYPCSERIANPDPLSHDRWLTWQSARKACERHYQDARIRAAAADDPERRHPLFRSVRYDVPCPECGRRRDDSTRNPCKCGTED